MTLHDGANRIGQILVERGILSEQQVFEIVQIQRRRGIPFGALAERMYEVTPAAIEAAWAEQYRRIDGMVDLAAERVDSGVLPLINRRQAWQFEVLPLRRGPSGELVLAASQDRLPRAVVFIQRRVTPAASFRIAEPRQLRRFLMRYYPLVSPRPGSECSPR